jgi:hypothetical protein
MQRPQQLALAAKGPGAALVGDQNHRVTAPIGSVGAQGEDRDGVAPSHPAGLRHEW